LILQFVTRHICSLRSAGTASFWNSNHKFPAVRYQWMVLLIEESYRLS
jgi:hypothetical protein